ncbi:DNA-binding NarL/FixJ family response regulator [Rhizobium tibeticum]|uniref:response regulator transcription factor n=1 Tax=Rhizobium tibeticum TaxID=501024 RepID=UPI002785FA11|nr:response regulator transcription factor [Rhizobium tibeticum]MDP9807695.1 DNA-binding NarL/FixJ family response regulator [Rhizobium tibeticum]
MNYVPSEFESARIPLNRLRPATTLSKATIDFEHSDETHGDDQCLLIVDARTLERECLATTLRANGLGMSAVAVGSIAEWRKKKDTCQPVGAVLLNIAGGKANDAALSEEIANITSELAPAPVIILADGDDLSQMLRVLEYGARGFIPTSVGIEVCVEAIALAVAGGTFIVAGNSFSAAAAATVNGSQQQQRPNELARIFTLRQAEVVQALRKGKANKIIAYELNLRESTVKVHIRNIMKKLKATNRTEVAYKLNDIFQSDARWATPAE